MAYYVYILQSEKDSTFYVGYTGNLDSLLAKHNTATKGYTSRKQPWKLVYSEVYEDKSTAIKREKFLKRQKNRSFYERLIG